MPQAKKTKTKRKSHLSSDWLTTSELCNLWGCSRDHLQTLRKQRILKPKLHYKNISPYAARPTYRYHRGRCEKALEVAEESTQPAAGEVGEPQPILEAIALAEAGKLDAVEGMR